MTYNHLKQRLDAGEVVIMDSGTGTELQRRGASMDPAAWCGPATLRSEKLLTEIHTDYIAAGAEIVTANTFASSRLMLSRAGYGEQVEEINRRGVELAREASADRAWVGGAMGPLGVRIEPFGHIGRDEAREVFAQQARALAEAGVDLIILETFVHLPELEEAVAAVRGVCVAGHFQFQVGRIWGSGTEVQVQKLCL